MRPQSWFGRWVGHRTGRGSGPALLLAALLVLTGCAQPADRVVIAVLVASGGQPSPAPASAGVEDGAADGVVDGLTDPVPVLRDRIELRCRECRVIVRADTTPAALRDAVEDGADVVVAQPATSEQGAELVAAAGAVPVVAFETGFPGADYYVGYDRVASAGLLAKAVSRQVGGSGPALVVPGSADQAVPADADAQTLRRALGRQGIRIAGQQPTGAQETEAWIADRLRGPGGDRVAAIVAGSDAASVAVARALSRRPIAGRPLLAGVGGELLAVRRVIRGDQTLAVHSPQTRSARSAADVAVSLASADQGADLEAQAEVAGVPATVFDPVIVSRDNVTEAVVRDGTYTTKQLCSGDVRAACRRLGII